MSVLHNASLHHPPADYHHSKLRGKTITRGLIRLAPGNLYTTDRNIPPATRKTFAENWRKDVVRTVSRTMWGMVRNFDFGTSLKEKANR